MSVEVVQNKYQDSVATVVGGEGQLGSRIVKGLKDIGVGQVMVCEKNDPFTEFVRQSNHLFFAVDADQTRDMIGTARGLGLIKPSHDILDGTSVKTSLIPLYLELDQEGVSVSSTHLGSVPAHPWRGIKLWLCDVGSNSERAKRLAFDLFIAKNTSIQVIDINDHKNVEQDQWFTFAMMHLFAGALRRLDFPLKEFNKYATLNAELATLPFGRTLGQGTIVPSEVLFTQPRKREFIARMHDALRELDDSLADREKLQKIMDTNIQFHDDPMGYIDRIFRKAGIVGSRSANLRMFAFSFRIVDDRPGKLRELLDPFYEQAVNLTAIDSMPGTITQSEEEKGVDPDKIVDFDIGVDLKTMSEEKERKIKDRLWEMGCTISYSGHQLNS